MTRDERELFVRSNHTRMSEVEMAAICECSPSSIQDTKRRLGIKKRVVRKRADIEREMSKIEEIVCAAGDVGITVKEIMKRLDQPTTEQALNNQMKKLINDRLVSKQLERVSCGFKVYRYFKQDGQVKLSVEEISTKLLMMPLSQIGSHIRPLSNTIAR